MLRTIIFSLILLFSVQVFASIGTISAVRGDASFIRDNQQLAIKIGDGVEEKDQIKTGKDTKVQIIFKDRTIVTVGNESVFSVPEYVFGDASNSKVQFNLAKGVFKSISGKIGKLAPQRFKIKTKTSTIGIRGTTYIVRVVGSETSLATISGETFMVLNTNGASYTVPAGKELVYNVDTGNVTVQNLTSTSVSLNATTTSGEDKTQTADSSGSSSSESSSSSGDDQSTVNVDSNLSTATQQAQATPVTAGKTEHTLYGYWLNPITNEKYSPFFGGLPGVSQTTSAEYDAIKATASTGYFAVASYSGKLNAISGTQSSAGDISMKVDFTNGKVENGYLTFTLSGDTWATNFSGTATTSGLSVSSFTSSTNSTVSNVSGSLKGTFYGSSALGIGGDFSLSGTNASNTAVSAQGSYGVSTSGSTTEADPNALVKTEAGSDSYTSYGYWLNSTTQEKSTPYSEALSGISQTDPSVIAAATATQRYTSYTGSLQAFSGSSAAVKGSISMSVNFGSSVSGNFNFTLNGNTWNPYFSGTTDNNGITVTSFSDYSGMNNISGTLNGKFYGSSAQGVGGTFDLTGTTVRGEAASAQGSYAASGTGIPLQ